MLDMTPEEQRTLRVVQLKSNMRIPKEFMTALLTGPEFENIRRIMDVRKFS